MNKQEELRGLTTKLESYIKNVKCPRYKINFLTVYVKGLKVPGYFCRPCLEIMIKISKPECMICKKMFTTTPDYEGAICSSKCKQIFDESYSNKKECCYFCEKKLKTNEIATWNEELQEKRVYSDM